MSKSAVRTFLLFTVLPFFFFGMTAVSAQARSKPDKGNDLDSKLQAVLHVAGFTGRIEETLQNRLGRRINYQLAEIGRMLWFDTIIGLNDDNTCAGCHSPTNGFGDTQSIAIGIDNNGIVGPNRAGPRNMRRTPTAINTAFFPNLMWNSRFIALSADPFVNDSGFQFPQPEGLSLSHLPHLLGAQAFIPPTERTEAAGFSFPGDNDAIRAEVLRRINAVPAYRQLFGQVFPEVAAGSPITFDMFGKAIAEFEFTLTFANAPVDQFARGNINAMTKNEKAGALLFFGQAQCSTCHSVAGSSNEMFSDFKDHVAGIPQLVPQETNIVFDGPNTDEDFGLEEFTRNPQDRYKFRTSPLRNVAIQVTFMHDGAFTNLEAALHYHLNTVASANSYSPTPQGLDSDLAGPIASLSPIIARLDPLLVVPIHLTNDQFEQLLAFVRCGLLDQRALPKNLKKLVPLSVPSGKPVLKFEFKKTSSQCH